MLNVPEYMCATAEVSVVPNEGVIPLNSLGCHGSETAFERHSSHLPSSRKGSTKGKMSGVKRRSGYRKNVTSEMEELHDIQANEYLG